MLTEFVPPFDPVADEVAEPPAPPLPVPENTKPPRPAFELAETLTKLLPEAVPCELLVALPPKPPVLAVPEDTSPPLPPFAFVDAFTV